MRIRVVTATILMLLILSVTHPPLLPRSLSLSAGPSAALTAKTGEDGPKAHLHLTYPSFVRQAISQITFSRILEPGGALLLILVGTLLLLANLPAQL